jgi:hypothetical protein
VTLELPELNLILIDFQSIHKKYEYELIEKLSSYCLIGEKFDTHPDITKILYHFTIKGIIDHFNSVKSNNKLVLYYNNTQFYESDLFEHVPEQLYLDILTKIFKKIQNILPIKIVITSKSLNFFKELILKQDGRARATIFKIHNTINNFKIEQFTFEKVKKFACKYDLTFLKNEYLNDVRTKQIVFR